MRNARNSYEKFLKSETWEDFFGKLEKYAEYEKIKDQLKDEFKEKIGFKEGEEEIPVSRILEEEKYSSLFCLVEDVDEDGKEEPWWWKMFSLEYRLTPEDEWRSILIEEFIEEIELQIAGSEPTIKEPDPKENQSFFKCLRDVSEITQNLGEFGNLKSKKENSENFPSRFLERGKNNLLKPTEECRNWMRDLYAIFPPFGEEYNFLLGLGGELENSWLHEHLELRDQEITLLQNLGFSVKGNKDSRERVKATDDPAEKLLNPPTAAEEGPISYPCNIDEDEVPFGVTPEHRKYEEMTEGARRFYTEEAYNQLEDGDRKEFFLNLGKATSDPVEVSKGLEISGGKIKKEKLERLASPFVLFGPFQFTEYGPTLEIIPKFLGVYANGIRYNSGHGVKALEFSKIFDELEAD